jgi:hypothetical protein
LTRLHYRPQRHRLKRAAARDRATSAAWGWHENVVGLGVGWKRVEGRRGRGEPCVTFYVLRKEPSRRLLARERIPNCLELASIETEVLTDVVQVPGRFVAHARRERPVRPRAEVGHVRGGRGTVGPIVTKGGSPSVFLLSCSHVIARSGGLIDFGKNVEQPVGDDEADVIGTVTDFTDLSSAGTVTADVALARLTVPAAPAIGGTGIVPTTFSPRAARDFDRGTRTVLYGHVTNGARGSIEAFESTWEIDEMPFVTGRVHFAGLVAYTTRCAKGDSGGLVMSGRAGEEATVLGIHTAGGADGRMGLFQPIAPIMKKYGLALATAAS